MLHLQPQANEAVKAAEVRGVRVIALKADSADPSAVAAAVEGTVNELGGIDILLYVTGASLMIDGGFTA